MPTLPRSVVVAIALAFAAAVIGLGWDLTRFGTSLDATVRRLEGEVRRQVSAKIQRVESLARQVAADGALVVDAASSRDRLPSLFARLTTLAESNLAVSASATVYVPTARGYRVLAWSDGPARDINPATSPLTTFVAPGPAGLRLVFLTPIDAAGRRAGVVVTETVLTDAMTSTPAPAFWLNTSFGPVSVDRQFPGTGELATKPSAFVVTAADGSPLLEVNYARDQLALQRRLFRSRVLAAAAVPLVLVLLLGLRPVFAHRLGRPIGPWLGWTFVAAGILAAVAIALVGLARLSGVPVVFIRLVWVLVALALATLLPVSLWGRRTPRRFPSGAPFQFCVEHAVGGVLLALAIRALAATFGPPANPGSLERAPLSTLPADVGGLVDLVTVLVTQLAIAWSITTFLAMLAGRWRLSVHKPAPSLIAALLWCAPVAALGMPLGRWPPVPLGPAVGLALITVGFAWFSGGIRRYARHTTQAIRLLLLYCAVVVPPLAMYPLAASTSDRAARALIEQDFAPAIARHPQVLQDQLAAAQTEIDRLAVLPQYVSSGKMPDSRVAFEVWKQTSLSRSRVTSNIELYAADRTLVSRFPMSLPEFVYRASAPSWQGKACQWEVFGEVMQLGAEDRRMLTAERGICDLDGRLLGGVVVHVAQSDYQALPFVSTADPYVEALDAGAAMPPARPADLQVVVYGWSLKPLYRSGRLSWPISEATFARVYDSRQPFWTTLEADKRPYHVYFTQDRLGVYAVGYPVPSAFDHATRIAELMAVTAGLFILFQLGTLLYTPLIGQRAAPLRVLFHEIRTSFYRKLFLFFVLAAIGPVLLFALAFGAYTTARFRADIESEAKSSVAVAKRVFEELAAAQQPAGQSAIAPSDDEMVWIRHVTDQDVNLYQGATLVATSRRDLFDSGLLPTRTPATVYRDIVLSRLPSSVVQDRLGARPYLIVAAPVRASGADDWLISVPLASRQRDIEREIDDLNRRVLVGALIVVLFAAGLGASIAGRISDPVARLTRATRLIAAGRLDTRIATDTADELRRLVDDFNSMAATLLAQRTELARTNQLEAWNEMARQVAHEIKNPLTPVQLAAEHLQNVHTDRGRPLGEVVDQCVTTILGQVRLLRQIASEFANFAGTPNPRLESLAVADLVRPIVAPYTLGLAGRVTFALDLPADLAPVQGDRTLLTRAITNLIENAVQAMPGGGSLTISARPSSPQTVSITIADTGVGMDALARDRAFEPYFSTKTGGSGLGLANARRNIETCGGTVSLTSEPGAGTSIVITLAAARADAPATA